MKEISRMTMPFLAIACVIASSTAKAQDDRQLVEGFYTQLLSGTTSPELPNRIAELLAPTWQSLGDYTNPPKTREQFLAQLQATGKAVPNLSWKVEEMLQVGNRYIVRGRATAKPVLPFFGVQPSGRGFDIMSIDIHTVEAHKIVKSYHIEDWHGAIRQLNEK